MPGNANFTKTELPHVRTSYIFTQQRPDNYMRLLFQAISVLNIIKRTVELQVFYAQNRQQRI